GPAHGTADPAGAGGEPAGGGHHPDGQLLADGALVQPGRLPRRRRLPGAAAAGRDVRRRAVVAAVLADAAAFLDPRPGATAPADERALVLGARPAHRGTPGRLDAARPDTAVRPGFQPGAVPVRRSGHRRRPVRRALRAARPLLALPEAGAGSALSPARRRGRADAGLAGDLLQRHLRVAGVHRQRGAPVRSAGRLRHRAVRRLAGTAPSLKATRRGSRNGRGGLEWPLAYSES